MSPFQLEAQTTSRTRSSGRLVIKISTLLFVIILLMAVSIYFSGADSMGTIELAIAIMTFLLCFKNCKMQRAIPILILVGCVLFMLFFSGQRSATGFNAPIKHALKFVHLLFAFVSYLFFRYASSEKEKKTLIYVVFFAAAASCLRSIYLVYTGNDYAIRYAARYGYSSDVAGFSQIYGVPLLIVIVWSLLFNGKKKKFKEKLLLIVLLAIYLYFIYVSLMATALMLTVIGILLFVLVKMLRKNATTSIIVLISLLFMAMLVIFVFPNQIMSMVIKLTENMNYVVQNRIRYVFQSVLNVSSGIAYNHERREELAAYSLNTFKEHPIFGVGYSGYGYGVIGCHQEWPDMLGVFGLLGSIVVWGIIIRMIMVTYKGLGTHEEKDLFLVLAVMFGILGFLNPCLGSPLLFALFVIAPNVKVLFRSRLELT